MQYREVSRKAARNETGREVGRYAFYNSAPSSGRASKSSDKGALPQRYQGQAWVDRAHGGERAH
ncbi:hypothetical protein XAC3218_1120015 [Xanthomonas citri pv. citri]|nr:hypothetical protein XAC3218_1120015 [Xanthomonas citri pv. citri]CEH83491.1 hypothetical protein XACB302_10730009 [Xanthomonas citri pv. citri]